MLFYRKHPNQQLKKEFRCQFHTLYHKKVVLLPSGLLVIDQWLTPRLYFIGGFGSLSDDKDAGSTVDSNAGE